LAACPLSLQSSANINGGLGLSRSPVGAAIDQAISSVFVIAFLAGGWLGIVDFEYLAKTAISGQPAWFEKFCVAGSQLENDRKLFSH
jgi:hypothetical protein